MIRGTMYPSLDLPFRGMSNETEKTGTALLQLQALYFAIADLGLYLDTHATDQDALALYNQYVEQYTDAMQKYERQHGSLTQMDSAMNGHYDWLKDPWPWDYDQNKEA
jgi:spore coat protein JB